MGKLEKEELTASPEFEDLRLAAAKAGLPLKDVHEHVMAAYRGRK